MMDLKNNGLVRATAVFVVSGFGAGLLPKAPGTWSTFLAGMVYWFILHLLFSAYNHLIWFGVLIFVIGVISIPMLHVMLSWKLFPQPMNKKQDDPSEAAIDEFVAFLLGMYMVCFIQIPHWQDVVIMFFLFRFFDIVKPFPIRAIEKIPYHPAAILADDIMAVFYAFIVWYVGIYIAFQIGLSWLVYF